MRWYTRTLWVGAIAWAAVSASGCSSGGGTPRDGGLARSDAGASNDGGGLRNDSGGPGGPGLDASGGGNDGSSAGADSSMPTGDGGPFTDGGPSTDSGTGPGTDGGSGADAESSTDGSGPGMDGGGGPGMDGAVMTASIALTPRLGGPNVVGTSQHLRVTVKDAMLQPVVATTVQLQISGANSALSGMTSTTSTLGVANFAYAGAARGVDLVVASVSGLGQSNTSTIVWVAPQESLAITTVSARILFSSGAGSFDIPPGMIAFEQQFPGINFNPPAGTIPGNTSGVDVTTRPFTNVTTDQTGNFTGVIVVQGNGLQAGVGSLTSFDMELTGSFIVRTGGQVTLNFYSDDGWILGISSSTTAVSYVSGPQTNPPPGNITPLMNYPVVASYNTSSAPTPNTVVLNFPAAGVYPFEIDYSECCGGQLALTLASPLTSNHGIPPIANLAIVPSTVTSSVVTPVRLSVSATDDSGAPLVAQMITLTSTGANVSTATASTDMTGVASFRLSHRRAGTDVLQASATIFGSDYVSNVAHVTWNP
jgi:hypothetical protein